MPSQTAIPNPAAHNHILAIGFNVEQQEALLQKITAIDFHAEFVSDLKLAEKAISHFSPSDYCAFIIHEDGLQNCDLKTFQKLHNKTRYQQVPIILQLNNNHSSMIQQGFNMDMFFYLISPYSTELLRTVLNAANTSFSQYQHLNQQIEQFEKTYPLLQQAEFKLKTVAEAQNLSSVLAYMTPEPKRSAIGLFELIINAIEHGNLEIGYQKKSELVAQGELQKEIDRRLAQDAFKNRDVRVKLKRTDDCLSFEITDNGVGFDAKPYLDFNPQRAMDNHGRGIMIANRFSFDQLTYSNHGSTVTAKILLPKR